VATSLITDTAPSGVGVGVDRRLGSRVYLRVSGALAPALQMSDVKIDHNGTLNPFGDGSVRVSYVVTNVGNVRLQADSRDTCRSSLTCLSSCPGTRSAARS
jgi:hypothetical protein